MTDRNSDMRVIGYDLALPHLDWSGAIEALRRGHLLPRAQIRDLTLGPATATLLSRAAHIQGLGYGSKTVTVLDANAARGLPTVQGAMLVFDDDSGTPRVIVDSRLVTEFKTAADSALCAKILARPDSQHLVILGAGTVARSLVQAYRCAFPGLERISIWSRRPEQAQALAASLSRPDAPVAAIADLQDAIAGADILSSATMARQPIIRGDWVRPGTHVDLIGAYKADMREADDALIGRGALFVDSRDTTIGHIGELMIPLASGVISTADVLGDLYDLIAHGARGRADDRQVTVCKNGGGAHLDLMIASWIIGSVPASHDPTR